MTAPHCYTPQHTTPHCNTLQHTGRVQFVAIGIMYWIVATHCNALQHTAPHCNTRPPCNTWHHTATHCNTLQHTATHRLCEYPHVPCDSLALLRRLYSCLSLQHAVSSFTARHSTLELSVTATLCNISGAEYPYAQDDSFTCSGRLSLQHSVAHCNTLQNTATHTCDMTPLHFREVFHCNTL